VLQPQVSNSSSCHPVVLVQAASERVPTLHMSLGRAFRFPTNLMPARRWGSLESLKRAPAVPERTDRGAYQTPTQKAAHPSLALQ
jgi:hypothetical protein